MRVVMDNLSVFDFIQLVQRVDRHSLSEEALEIIFNCLSEYETVLGGIDLDIDVKEILTNYCQASDVIVAQRYGIDISNCASSSDISDKVESFLKLNMAFIGKLDNGDFVFITKISNSRVPF